MPKLTEAAIAANLKLTETLSKPGAGTADLVAEYLMAITDPETGFKATLLALQEAMAELAKRDEPAKVSFTVPALSSLCPFPCGVPLYPNWLYCPNCGKRLEWA